MESVKALDELTLADLWREVPPFGGLRVLKVNTAAIYGTGAQVGRPVTRRTSLR